MSKVGTETSPRWPRQAANGPAVEIAHLRKTYGALVAVDDVSFSVAEGEIFGILGPNGAGKTTTVECAALDTPASLAAQARGGKSVRFLPSVFFAGLWLPRALMPGVLQDISNYTPLGAAVEAIQDSMLQQGFPPAAPLLVLAAYALVFAFLARRFFRWE